MPDDLVQLFESDDGQLFVQPKKQVAATADDRLTASFQQIVDFVEKNDRLPEIEAVDISEAGLAARLASIRADSAKSEALRPIDSLGLLETPEAPESIDELFSDDTFGLFNGVGDDILRVKNVPVVQRASPDDVATRKRAEDFDVFRAGFADTQESLRDRTAKLVRFTSVTQLKAGVYFVAGGQMLYVADIGEEKMVHGRMKSRIRAIYENGTESNLYLRSLSSQLYYDGYCVVSSDYNGELQLDAADKIAGHIYVLRSRSQDEKITTIKNLHKIGFTSTTVAERIKDAENDPTYLMAGVEVVDSYIITGDYNTQKVEHFIHRIFADVKVDLKIIDRSGQEYTPSEWYAVPLVAIEQAVNMLQNGDITEYKYDKDLEQLILRNA